MAASSSSSSSSSSKDVPIFVDTSFGTHIALAASPNITAGDLKRELESTHKTCFPKFGEIMVNGIMVKRKSIFYHLPASMPIKHAFQGMKATWFIFMEASSQNIFCKSALSHSMAAGVKDCTSNYVNLADFSEGKNYGSRNKKSRFRYRRKKRIMKRFNFFGTVFWAQHLRAVHVPKCNNKSRKRKRLKKKCFPNNLLNDVDKRNLDGYGITAKESFANSNEERKEWNYIPQVESSCDTSSRSASVSGIIKKYFSNYGMTSSSEVTSLDFQNMPAEKLKARADDTVSNIRFDKTPACAAKNCARVSNFPFHTHPSSKISEDKQKNTEVGKRLILASNSLGISATKQKPTVSLCRFKDGKLLSPKSSIVRNLIFEISDQDDGNREDTGTAVNQQPLNH